MDLPPNEKNMWYTQPWPYLALMYKYTRIDRCIDMCIHMSRDMCIGMWGEPHL